VIREERLHYQNILQEAEEQENRYILARAFRDLINLDGDCEMIKAELAQQEEFNLIEAFGVVD
jgi:hypothetical protein